MRTNNTVMLVAGREISTRARQRSFLVSTGLILLVIIATVILSEWVSAKVRHAII